MFDPHGVRRYKRRTSRKGQIIQARAVQDPFVINPLHVNAYKDFIIKNHLIDSPTPPEPQPSDLPKFESPFEEVISPNTVVLQPEETRIVGQSQTFNDQCILYLIRNTSVSPITISNVEYQSDTSKILVHFDNDQIQDFQAEITEAAESDINLNIFSAAYIKVPMQWVRNSLE